MKKPIGYIVFEASEDFEQSLYLDTSSDKPSGGVLDWRDGRPVRMFPNRKEASLAITRTEHYRIAFASSNPERKFCKIVPVSGE